jgi:hypothetical protein
MILGFYGHSNSGKTSIIEGLVKRLKVKGYRVAVVKHTAHRGFELDTEGTDSWRFRKAGAVLVDRKVGDEKTIYIPRAAVCLCGGIQPETLRRALSPEFFECGLAARLLLAMPPKRLKRWSEADIDGDVLAAMSRCFDGLLALQPCTNGDGEPEPGDPCNLPEQQPCQYGQTTCFCLQDQFFCN